MPLLMIAILGMAAALIALILRRGSRTLREIIDPPDAPRDPADAVTILSDLPEPEGEMQAGRLVDAGIPAFTRGVRIERTRYTVDVCVAAADADRALAVLGIGDT